MLARRHLLALALAFVPLTACRVARTGDRTPAPPLDAAPSSAQPQAASPTASAAEAANGDQASAPPRTSRAELRAEAARVLDDWHAAAAVGARDRYVGHFAPDAVFLGTDATERWDLATFTAYVDEYFEPGSGWAYEASERQVVIGPNDQIAWFDEALESAGYGALRGTGVLRRDGDSWRIAHYNMTFTVPNGVARAVVDLVRAAGD